MTRLTPFPQPPARIARLVPERPRPPREHLVQRQRHDALRLRLHVQMARVRIAKAAMLREVARLEKMTGGLW